MDSAEKSRRKKITKAWGELQGQVASGTLVLDTVQQTMFDMVDLLIIEVLEMKAKSAVVESNAKFMKALEGG